jgi:hypothetical protein
MKMNFFGWNGNHMFRRTQSVLHFSSRVRKQKKVYLEELGGIMDLSKVNVKDEHYLLPEAHLSPTQLQIHLTWLSTNYQIGLGEVIKRTTSWFGIQPCEPCNHRAEWLNQILVFSGKASQPSRQPGGISPPAVSTIWTMRSSANASGSCWRFNGPCTGFGKRQCVTAPSSQEPGAGINHIAVADGSSTHGLKSAQASRHVKGVVSACDEMEPIMCNNLVRALLMDILGQNTAKTLPRPFCCGSGSLADKEKLWSVR